MRLFNRIAAVITTVIAAPLLLLGCAAFGDFSKSDDHPTSVDAAHVQLTDSGGDVVMASVYPGAGRLSKDGVGYLRVQDWDRAIASLNSAAESRPKDHRTRYALGVALEAAGDLSAARGEYSRANSLKANNEYFDAFKRVEAKAAASPASARPLEFHRVADPSSTSPIRIDIFSIAEADAAFWRGVSAKDFFRPGGKRDMIPSSSRCSLTLDAEIARVPKDSPFWQTWLARNERRRLVIFLSTDAPIPSGLAAEDPARCIIPTFDGAWPGSGTPLKFEVTANSVVCTTPTRRGYDPNQYIHTDAAPHPSPTGR